MGANERRQAPLAVRPPRSRAEGGRFAPIPPKRTPCAQTGVMVDPDDVEAISLEHALRDLCREAREHADPSMVLDEWFCWVALVLLKQQSPGRPITWVMLACARRVTSDARAKR